VSDPVTILLVEDNPDDAALTGLALREGVPAKIEVARDGQDALDYLFNDANDLPRLVLLDLKLPSTDGLALLRRIRERERTCLTARGDPDELQRARRRRRGLSIRGQQLRPQADRLRAVLRAGPSDRQVLARGQRAADE
jgi:CheY-like chemotaxis protein